MVTKTPRGFMIGLLFKRRGDDWTMYAKEKGKNLSKS